MSAETPNFGKINYALRPAKNVERKMLCEAFGRLSILDDIKNYGYIGFGSAYFTDFSLFHKNLGIHKLLSIEKEIEYKERVDFNNPFSCIKIKYGDSSSVLANLPWHDDWNCKVIVWLDYTGKLNESMLGDIDIVVSNINPGSIVLISVNIEPDKYDPATKIAAKPWRVKQLRKRVGSKRLPFGTDEINLTLENNKKVIREIIHNGINSAVLARSSGSVKVHYQQLFNFYYNDGSDMLTVGGIIYDANQTDKIQEMNLQTLDFIKENEESFDITVPNLTFREIHALDRTLPVSTDGSIVPPLSEDDIENYKKIYRYFPAFTEASL